MKIATKNNFFNLKVNFIRDRHKMKNDNQINKNILVLIFILLYK